MARVCPCPWGAGLVGARPLWALARRLAGADKRREKVGARTMESPPTGGDHDFRFAVGQRAESAGRHGVRLLRKGADWSQDTLLEVFHRVKNAVDGKIGTTPMLPAFVGRFQPCRRENHQLLFPV